MNLSLPLVGQKLDAAVAALDALGKKTTRLAVEWNSRWTKPWMRWAEILAALALVAVSCFYLYQIAQIMVTNPLQGDEVGTIKTFSSKGAKYVATHYGVAKNHIFFNLLNAWTPHSKDYTPWRGRFWSFVAFAALLTLALRFFLRRQWILEGALFFFFSTTSQKMLETNLAARGYGLLAFFTLTGCLLVHRYFEKPGWKPAAWLCVCVTLGTYTMPHYILYGGVLILLLFLRTWDWRVCLLGIATVIAIGLLYAPVLSQLSAVVGKYADTYGESYPDFNAVYTTISYYLLQQKPWVVFAALMGTGFAPFVLWPRTDSTAKPLQILVVAAFLFLVICLKLETPRLRTTDFVTIPLLFTGVLAAGRIYRWEHISSLRPLLALACVAPLIFSTWTRANDFHFTPKENYLGSAQIIRAIFPAGVAVHVNERPDKLQHTLPAGYVSPVPFDSEAWKRGELVMLDSDFRTTERFAPTGVSADAIELRVKQAKGGYQAVSFVPPNNDLLVWTQNQPGQIEIKIKPGPPLYSINILTEKTREAGEWQFENERNLAKKIQSFPSQNGTLYTITGIGKPPVSLRLRLNPPANVLRIWAVPGK
ncbi:MAG: hypothetical protein ABIT76_12500 [Chthoniobacterales bacterium]